MKVSVITVSFNSGKTIEDTVLSVLDQSYPDVEYVVVDGGSTDETLQVLERYRDRIGRIVSEPDQGIYDAMNKGIQMATGDLVGTLNSDDRFESKDALRWIVDAFESSPESEIVFGDVVITSSSDVGKVKRYYSSKRFQPWKLRFGWMPPHPSTYVRRSVYEQSGTYKLGYRISADYERFVRWLLVDRRVFKRIDRVIVRMRAGGASSSGLSSYWTLNREIVKACRENGVYTNEMLLLGKIPFKLMELVRRPAEMSHG